jgi:hypothetical protein
MAYTNIDLPTEYFNTKLYTGTGATNSLTGVGFQPDWVWIKKRNPDDSHSLYDVVRGTTKSLRTNGTDAEQTRATTLTSFDSDGFTLSTNNEVNASGATFASWNWKANGTGVSNTAGTITSTVSANTTSGFSIVGYTGNGVSNSTIGHGLGVTPAMIFIKNRPNVSSGWRIFHKSLGLTGGVPNYLLLPNTDGSQTGDTGVFYSSPTSTLFSVGTNGQVNGSGETLIAYCFAEVKGFSKFGSYTGNGSADGTFVYLGFRPAFIMRKRTDTTADWRMDDSKRDGYNVIPHTLFPNYDNAETTNSGYNVDLLSNGFKCRATSVNQNASGGTYIYMAFAENPFVSSTGIPTTAR